MPHEGFTHEQWEAIRCWLGSPLRRFNRLLARLERTPGVFGTRFHADCVKARHAIFHVHLSAHYLSCQSGVTGANESRDYHQDAEKWRGDGI